LLVAGERATVALSTTASVPVPAVATVLKVTVSEVQRALAWQERRLEFDSTPLAEVVREFNRYNRRHLVIADTELATRRFSGMFRADGYEALVGLLEKDFGVTVTRGEGEIVLRAGR
jgi:transmembrane sensor